MRQKPLHQAMPWALRAADCANPRPLRSVADLAAKSDMSPMETRVNYWDDIVEGRMRHPKESIPGHLASAPLGPRVAALDASTRAAPVENAAMALQAFRHANGMTAPQGTHTVTARKSLQSIER